MRRFWVGALVGANTVLAAALVVAGVLLAFKTPAPVTEPHRIAEQFGVQIVWGVSSPAVWGEFDTADPDVIYVRPGLSEADTYRVILHEIGHVLQHRLGLPSDECGADDFAMSLGAGPGPYVCD